MEDLNRAINCAEDAAELTYGDDLARAWLLKILGSSHTIEFELAGNTRKLDRAIEFFRAAVELTPQKHFKRSSRLNSLSNALRLRFERSGFVGDLTESISASDEAVQSSLTSAPQNLNNYAISLQRRFSRMGQRKDLNDSVSVLDRAVRTAKKGDPDRPIYLNNLGNALQTRFDRMGDMEDLDRAIETFEESIRFYGSHSNTDRALLLNGLGNALVKVFNRTRQIEYLNKAIISFDRAIQLLPTSSYYFCDHLNSLASALRLRAEKTNSTTDLDRAIASSEEVLRLMPDDHPDRSTSYNHLANSMSLQYKYTSLMQYLDRCISLYEEAVLRTPQDHPNRTLHLSNLGKSLELRKHPDDLRRAFDAYETGANLSSAPPTIRIVAAVRAARLVVDKAYQKASQLYKLAVELLPMASPVSLGMLDQESILKEFAGLASEAAAAMLDERIPPSDVLQLLELGRGVMIGGILDIRSDVLELPDDLAQQYDNIRATLDPPVQTLQWGLGTADRADASCRQEAELRLESLTEEIRRLESFENFRCPLTQDDFLHLAVSGPIVVINIDIRRCDALIIARTGISCQSLPRVQYKTLKEYVRQFRFSIQQIEYLSREIDALKGSRIFCLN